MLSKIVCKKCTGKIPNQHGKPFPWSCEDDRNWIAGSVVCPLSLRVPEDNIKAKVKSAPPEWCPFPFEHAVGVAESRSAPTGS